MNSLNSLFQPVEQMAEDAPVEYPDARSLARSVVPFRTATLTLGGVAPGHCRCAHIERARIKMELPDKGPIESL